MYGPFFETEVLVDGHRYYLFSSQLKTGFCELNRLTEGFQINKKGTHAVAPGKTEQIGHEIVRVLSQMYASTFDPEQELGFAPLGLCVNNGDIVVDWDSAKKASKPVEIAVCVSSGCSPTTPASFIDLISSPRDIHPETDQPLAYLMHPTPENLPAMLEAVTLGFKPRFGGEARDIAVSLFRDYARDHPERMEQAVTFYFNEIAGLIQRANAGDFSEPFDFAGFQQLRERLGIQHNQLLESFSREFIQDAMAASSSNNVQLPQRSSLQEPLYPEDFIAAIEQL